MVMDEPDAFELDDIDEASIGIFEPGSHFERFMDWSKFSQVLFLILAGMGILFGLTAVIMIPLIGIIGLYRNYRSLWNPY